MGFYPSWPPPLHPVECVSKFGREPLGLTWMVLGLSLGALSPLPLLWGAARAGIWVWALSGALLHLSLQGNQPSDEEGPAQRCASVLFPFYQPSSAPSPPHVSHFFTILFFLPLCFSFFSLSLCDAHSLWITIECLEADNGAMALCYFLSSFPAFSMNTSCECITPRDRANMQVPPSKLQQVASLTHCHFKERSAELSPPAGSTR